MISSIVFDYCALIVETLIVVSIVVRRMTRGRVNRWALVLISDIILTTIADIGAQTLEKIGPGNVVWKYIANAFSLWGTSMTSVIFCGYLFAMVGIWYRIRERRLLAYTYNIPIVLMTALVFVVNPLTRIIYSINEDGFYQRGPAFYALYALS